MIIHMLALPPTESHSWFHDSLEDTASIYSFLEGFHVGHEFVKLLA